jgi:MGT family glycosyltransferase
VARATVAAVRLLDPGTILVDHLAFGATLGLHAAGIPYGDVVLGHPSALPVGDELYGVPPAWPAALTPGAGDLAGLSQLAADVAERFTSDWNTALRALNPAAPPVDDAFRVHGEVVMYSYPEELHDARRSAALPEAHVFLGGAVRDELLDAETEAWLTRDPTRPLVVVSFGSFLSARDDVLARVVAALRDADPIDGGVRVALATGSADPAVFGRLPRSWLVRPFIPQVALVRNASLAITHAGNNGVTEALAAGIPLVVLPFSTDQFAVAADLERAGLGRALDPNRTTSDEIRGAVHDVLSGPARAAATRLGTWLRADRGPERARRALATLHQIPV